MQIVVHLGNRPVTLNFKDFEDGVDTDALLRIDHGNLYGEAVTISAFLNQIGILKVEADRVASTKKLEADIYEADLKQSIRKNAVSAGKKITENGITEKIDCDPGVIIKKKAVIKADYEAGIMNSLLVSAKSKDKKLDNLVRGVSPEELYQELIEVSINNILIKKRKSIID